ncbi:DUF6702 family protein [Mongoliitalea lutea]|uniref:Uncharacterized protein n=1 Tax=Mongoliitalea lutea TaxID=849756 RepID=A0A8J3CXH5_9BACT|nr:DUF6702 family protein [Mongoliitalea lutea]GHB40471.1 hypothetical protein GCM10008106_22140 [Mongoliitalea lutea]
MPLNFIFVLLFSFQLLSHPFYISLTEIRYNERQKSLEIAQKIFWDDLEVALGELHQTKVNFLKPESQEQLEQMIEGYLLKHNQIIVNNQQVKLAYLGYEVEEDAAWFYMEAQRVSAPKKVVIQSDILIEQFPGQQNIINFFVGSRPKSLILQKGKERGTLSF